jgi:hypothetical protein
VSGQPEGRDAVLDRVRRDVAATADQDWQARAEAAEAKVTAIRTVLLEGGQDAGTARRRALAIVSGEEEPGDG